MFYGQQTKRGGGSPGPTPPAPSFLPVIAQQNTPAVGPATGDRYLIGTAPTGAWAGRANQIAEWDGAAWQYTAPVNGYYVYVDATDTTLRYNGTSWIEASPQEIHQNGDTFGASGVRIGTKDTNPVWIMYNNTLRFRMDGSDIRTPGSIYVGIPGMTSAATARIHARGSTADNTAYALKIEDSAVASLMSIRNDGIIILNGLNIGKGTAQLSGNVVLGVNALAGATTGNDNVAIGSSALAKCSTGERNYAIGTSAMAEITTGSRNFAIGYFALSSNQTSDKNIAIGYFALAAHTTNEGNVAIGDRALISDTTGQFNIAICSNALQSNTTGNGNIAIGANALSSNTNGSDNTSIGYGSQASNNGTNNITIGKFSMNNATAASQNTCLGDNSGTNISTGNNNVVIGYNAGASNLSSASQCTVIGQGISPSSNADGWLVLGAGGTRRIEVDGSGVFRFNGPAVAADPAAISTHNVLINIGGTDYYFMVHT